MSMAYRRRQGLNRASTFKEEIYRPPEDEDSAPSLAAQAIRAHRDSSLGSTSFHYSFKDRSKGASTFDCKSPNQVGSLWGVLARKAKGILDDDTLPHQSYTNATVTPQLYQPCEASHGSKRLDNPTFRKRIDALTSSLNNLGDTIGNALQEGQTIVESNTPDSIQETRKLQIGRREMSWNTQNQLQGHDNSSQKPTVQLAQPLNNTSRDDQLKASRDVGVATAAKVKLLLRELKTVKADLSFAKQRCSQLEEENRILREARDKGDNPADDDMIRLQLETLLAEKARLAHENFVYARENRFLREIVEYHQLTAQDDVYLDEGIEEVTENYPSTAGSKKLSLSPSTTFPATPPEGSPTKTNPIEQELLTCSLSQKLAADIMQDSASP